MKRTIVVVVLALGTVMAAAPGAQASCVFIEDYGKSLNDSAYIFVGTVEGVSNGGRTATVAVAEAWRGDEDIQPSVTVLGGAAGEGVATSVDRTYDTGDRYLFAPYELKGGIFRDNACTPTRVFKPRLERFRPDNAVFYDAADEGSPEPSEAPYPGTPGDDASDEDDGIRWVPVVVAVVIVAGAGILLLRSRRSP